MPNELDRRFDEELAKVVGPGGGWSSAKTSWAARSSPISLQRCLPSSRRSRPQWRERSGCRGRRTADLRRSRPISDALALGLTARGIGKGDRVAIAMRNCPAWIVCYMAILKAGGIAALLNGWWEPFEMEHAVSLTEPTLIIADPPRAKRLAERCGRYRDHLPADRAAGRAGDRAADRRRTELRFPTFRPTTRRPSCSRPARRANRRARCPRIAP